MPGLTAIDFERRELRRDRFHNPEAPLDVRLLISTGALVHATPGRPSLARRLVRRVARALS